jgi:large subunit ribosomal protein L15
MDISTVNQEVNTHRGKKRVGRGSGSGYGKTATRGTKGQGSRSGFSLPVTFEGGQMPLVRRVPKRGFNNKRFADVVESVTLATLAALFDGSEAITPDLLKQRRIVDAKSEYVKVIGNDTLDKAFNVKAHAFSKGAQAAIEKAGGSVEVLPRKKPVVKNKMKQKNAG